MTYANTSKFFLKALSSSLLSKLPISSVTSLYSPLISLLSCLELKKIFEDENMSSDLRIPLLLNNCFL